MSLIACGSIHEGHERFILLLVMTLEEDKICEPYVFGCSIM